jgi:hypothetical protein
MKKYLTLMFLSLALIIAGSAEAAVHKVKIKISSTGTAATDYPVRINVDAKTLINMGLMNSDMRDVRFENESGTSLPFWIHFTEGMQRTIKNIPVWVKLDTLPATGDKYIYMSYNPSRTKNSLPLPPSDTYCGDHRNSPFSNGACGSNVFGMFAYDYRAATDYTYPSDGCNAWGSTMAPGPDFVRSASPYNYYESDSSFANSFLLHFRYHLNTKSGFNIYLLTELNTTPSLMESGTNCYKGYKISFETVTDVSTRQYSYKIKVYKRTSTDGSWSSDLTSGGYTWNPYRNSIQDFDIKVTAALISIYNNGRIVGMITRSDSFAGGHVGFYSTDKNHGECDSYMTSTISPIWVIDNYVGDPTVTVVGNTDVMIKRIKPTEDASSIGQDVIEDTAKSQILDDNVDGNNLDKYVYSGYPLANPGNQIFRHELTIKNRGIEQDTFNINLTLAGGSPSNWFIQYDYGSGLTSNMPGTGGTNTTGQITLAAGASRTITVTVMPSISALFEGAYGRLILDFDVTSTTDSSFDHARFVDNINGKSGCYWKKKMPITVSYTDSAATGNLVDYQVLVTLSDVDLSDARNDGADIIFTDNNGTTLPFWQKSFDKTGGSASYWVKVHSINSGLPGRTTIYMWWGNPGYSPTRSNEYDTFDLWENWESRTVGTRPGCPDGSTDATYNCTGQPTDPVWTNNPDSADPKNWWNIATGELNGNSILAASITSQDYGPILSGGDVRWKNYEAMYTLKKNNTGTKATYSPVLFTDPGNQWGTEYYDNEYIFRPTSYGTDWTWVYQTSPISISGYDSTFPTADAKYVNKIRVFHNPNGTNHLQVLITKADVTPTDRDSDTQFYNIADFYPAPAFSVDAGAIGFGGWDGGLAFDDVRIRKYTEPEPACSAGSPTLTSYQEITSLSNPVLTSPLLNGRSVLLNAYLKTWTWTGDLKAVYADCYIAGDCQTGEDPTEQGTISLWGSIDDATPKGFGDQLELAVAGDNNRSSIDDSSWQSNGRYIFTAYDSDNDDAISCTTTPADCIAFGTSNASTLKSSFGSVYSAEASPYTQTTNLIKYVRGQYVSGFSRSSIRNMCTSGTADTCQWKLGDITHSNPLVIGVPNMLYAGAAYSSFQRTNSSRDMVAYFTSNEGMLHAVRMATFNTSTKKYQTDSTATELWSFIPNADLPILSKTTDAYHEYTADGLLRAIDIKSGGAYKTVLIGSLRGGGQSLFALDVTNPRAPSLMWEINPGVSTALSNAFVKIGKTWSAPALGRLCQNTPCDEASTNNPWVAIIGSGLDPNDINNLSTKTAQLSIINLETGAVIKQITVSSKLGNITTNLGVLRDKNGYLQKIVFGDYYGALWRVNLATVANVETIMGRTALTDAEMLFKPSNYATADINGTPPARPITTQPAIAYAKDSSGNDLFWLYFGTGVFDIYDSDSPPYQRFYGLKDNVTTPYVDDDLKDMTASSTTNDPKQSWYLELGHTDSRDYQYGSTTTASCLSSCENTGYNADYCNTKCKDAVASTKNRNERVIASPTIYGGFVFLSTYTPASSACGGGVSRFYGLSYESGRYDGGLMLFGNVTDARSIALPATSSGVPSTPLVYSGKSGTGQVVASGVVNNSTGGLTKTPLDPNRFAMNVNVLLWRRIR